MKTSVELSKALSNGRRVLLVEDDPELVALVASLLCEADYQVDTATDGQQALHLGLTRDYDILLLDRGLPAMEGLDLLGRLRSGGIAPPPSCSPR
jgi:two-component system response regulator QseB